jgi:hypothetical protein
MFAHFQLSQIKFGFSLSGWLTGCEPDFQPSPDRPRHRRQLERGLLHVRTPWKGPRHPALLRGSAVGVRKQRLAASALPQLWSSCLLLGCQMGYFQTKTPNLGKFCRALDWNTLIYFIAIWNIVQTFGLFYDHFGTYCYIWYIFSGNGIMFNEKSGSPALLFRAGTVDNESAHCCLRPL